MQMVETMPAETPQKALSSAGVPNTDAVGLVDMAPWERDFELFERSGRCRGKGWRRRRHSPDSPAESWMALWPRTSRPLTSRMRICEVEPPQVSIRPLIQTFRRAVEEGRCAMSALRHEMARPE